MAKIVITDSGGLDFSPGIAVLDAAGHDTVLLHEGEGLLTHLADLEGLIVSFCRIDASVIAAAPLLKVIVTTTTGLDQIDMHAAKAAGIAVFSLPSPATEEVATHALAGILTLLREIPAAREASKCWDFKKIPAPPRISELTLAVYGMGRIARALVTLALPLFGRVVAYDPYISTEAWPITVGRVDSLNDLFQIADMLTLHAPATLENHHIVNTRTIELMPQGASIINVARGELVDTQALIAAVQSGRLRGAFLDVVDPEPPEADDPVLHEPRIVVTPHSAFFSKETELAYVMLAVENLQQIFE